jgi:hypothetical protein
MVASMNEQLATSGASSSPNGIATSGECTSGWCAAVHDLKGVGRSACGVSGGAAQAVALGEQWSCRFSLKCMTANSGACGWSQCTDASVRAMHAWLRENTVTVSLNERLATTLTDGKATDVVSLV